MLKRLLAEIESQLFFTASGMAIAAFALLPRNAAEQSPRVLVGVQYGIGNRCFIGSPVSPALAQNPVTDKVLIQADNEVFLIFLPAYYQGAFTVTRSGGECCSECIPVYAMNPGSSRQTMMQGASGVTAH